jgi:hypothetical protein
MCHRAAIFLSLLSLTYLVSADAVGIQDSVAETVRYYTMEVAPGQRATFEDGAENYAHCLQQYSSPHAHRAWEHETGSRWTYTFMTDLRPWSKFGGGSSPECAPPFTDEVLGNVTGMQRSFLEILPDLSFGDAKVFDAPYLDVTSFRVSDAGAFLQVIRALRIAAMKSGTGNYLLAQVVDGGRGSADFLLFTAYQNWNDFGQRRDELWRAAGQVYGESKSAVLHEQMRGAVTETWSELQSLQTDFSYTPAPAGQAH